MLFGRFLTHALPLTAVPNGRSERASAVEALARAEVQCERCQLPLERSDRTARLRPKILQCFFEACEVQLCTPLGVQLCTPLGTRPFGRDDASIDEEGLQILGGLVMG